MRVLLFTERKDSAGWTGWALGLPLLALAVAGCFWILLVAKKPEATGLEVIPLGKQMVEKEAKEAAAPNTVVELQTFRQRSSSRIRSGNGAEGAATIINLNPKINTWYLLEVTWQHGSKAFYHLENPAPHSRQLALDSNNPLGIEIVEGTARYPCNLFAGVPTNSLEQAAKSQLIYAPLCDGRVFLRNAAKGHRTSLEASTEYLRSNVWGGEKVIIFFHHLLADSHRETADMHPEAHGASGVNGEMQGDVPLPAVIDPKYAGQVMTPSNLGIALDTLEHAGLRPGSWYSASGNPGIYISLIKPELIDSAILQSHKATVNTLDNKEASSLCYLIAFDLDHFDLVYALGTDHPAVGWSNHIQSKSKDPKLPGPDGIGTIFPLISTGLIGPQYAQRVVAAFTGGFKRTHGAFKYGNMALQNHGTHYGFLENGVVFSKLQLGLATIFVLDDGSVRMKTWEEHDNQTLANVKYARQNGVPLVEFDEQSQSIVPGRQVNNWGAGNWSGSSDLQLRTMRSGAALQWNGKKRFLIYAVFSDATPSAMARVFQAYQCRYGMLLDMNALEHTYLALYRRVGPQLIVDHFISGMNQVEKVDSGKPIPRFLGYPDNRDFFFVTRHNP